MYLWAPEATYDGQNQNNLSAHQQKNEFKNTHKYNIEPKKNWYTFSIYNEMWLSHNKDEILHLQQHR